MSTCQNDEPFSDVWSHFQFANKALEELRRYIKDINKMISVIIPIYNAEKYLKRCIMSILRNTYSNLELLCINDGSTDNSEEILREIAREDSRLKVFSQLNSGVAVARNYGLDKAKGDFIAFVDADDWIHKNYFEYLLNSCRDGGCSIAVCQYCDVGDERLADENQGNDYKFSKLSVKESFEKFFIKTFVWGRLIDRRIIGDIRFEEGMRFGEDTTFMLRLLCENPDISISCLDNVLYYYYQKSEFTGRFSEATGYLPMIDAYLKYLNVLELQHEVELIIIEETIKKLLAYRYEARIEQKYKEAKYNFNTRFKTIKKHFKLLSVKKRIEFNVLAYFPSLYRLICIMRDNTWLEWEKKKRELIRIQRNMV